MRSTRNWILLAGILLSFPMASTLTAQEELTCASVLPLADHLAVEARRAQPDKGIYEPVSDWIRLNRY